MIVFILGYDDAQDICGPGAAGINLAMNWLKAEKKVVLLEAGG